MRHVAALLLGAVVALAAVLVHRHGTVATVLAVVTSLSCLMWLRRSAHRTLAAAFGLGWVVLVGVAVLGRPEGDWVVGSDPAGYAVMGCALAIVVLSVTALPRPDASRRA